MRKGRLGGIAALFGLVFLASTAMAGDLTFKVTPKKIKKAGPVMLYASGLRPGQLAM